MRVVIVQTTDVLTAKQVEAGEGSPLRDHVVDLCRKAKGPSYVLLVGAVKSKDPAGAAATVVPPLRGEAGRMKGQPSDNAFGSVDKDLAPKVAVGRFPANTVLEAQQMVKKTLVFERDGPSALWRNRLTLMVGNPGGRSAIEKQFGEILVQSLVKDRFQRAGIVHNAGRRADGKLALLSAQGQDSRNHFALSRGRSAILRVSGTFRGVRFLVWAVAGQVHRSRGLGQEELPRHSL